VNEDCALRVGLLNLPVQLFGFATYLTHFSLQQAELA
jgi:hypothetical protein